MTSKLSNVATQKAIRSCTTRQDAKQLSTDFWLTGKSCEAGYDTWVLDEQEVTELTEALVILGV